MKLFGISLLFILFTINIYSQRNTFYVGFWNLENLFDTVDQSEVDDFEFLPGSEKQWDQKKFNKKLVNLASVIMSMNNGLGPDILGICEVENRSVIDSLVLYLTPGYEIVHRDSPDERGIDNALIFRKELFTLITTNNISIDLGEGEKTRDILWSKLLLNNNNYTISVFVNHWPSRRGGEGNELKRIIAAKTLLSQIDKLSDYFIAIGDFNDEPENISIDSVFGAGPKGSGDKYLNLAYELSMRGQGSYKYRDTWNMLDQIIIPALSNKIKYVDNSFSVYKPDFLVTQKGNYAGTPHPTFGGKRYLGGYSDHFPVTAVFIY